MDNSVASETASSVRRLPSSLKSRLQNDRWVLLFIAVVAWVANYLHFTNFGLYEDDWFYAGFPFFVGYKTWMRGSLVDVLVRLKGQGRLLQMISIYTLTGFGELAKSLSVDYLIAYFLFLIASLLTYTVLRQRFSRLTTSLAALLFVLTPLDTLHQFLNGQFSFAPAFILVLGAILLYVKDHRLLAYALAALSILSYESIFFLFLGAPLLRSEDLPRTRRREWMLHLSFGAILIAFYFCIRVLVGESRASALPHGGALMWSVLYAWVFNVFTSFNTYLYGAVRASEADIEGWFYAIAFFVSVTGCLFYSARRHLYVTAEKAQARSGSILRDAGVGLVFLALGYPLSYFFFQTTPHLYLTDRETRISCAASFGSSLLLAVLLSGLFQAARSKAGKLIISCGIGGFLTVLFLYSFVIQQDYVNDWAEQREQARQIASLTPDIEPDSAIILKLNPPPSMSTVFGKGGRGIGVEKYMFEQEFGWLCAAGRTWPKLLIVYSDQWSKHLKRDSDGLMSWTEPTFDGRWDPATGRFRPGRFIVLEEKTAAVIVRNSQPIIVDGEQIVQQPVSDEQGPGLWGSVSQNYIVQHFLPETIWRSGGDFASKPPRLISPEEGAILAKSPVTFTWTRVRGAADYWIGVGTGLGKNDVVGSFTAGKTSITVDLSKHLTGEVLHFQVFGAFPDYRLMPGSGSRFTFPTRAPVAH